MEAAGLEGRADGVQWPVEVAVVGAGDQSRALGGVGQAEHDAQQRGLACPVGTEQCRDPPPRDGYRDRVERGTVVVGLGQLVGGDGIR